MRTVHNPITRAVMLCRSFLVSSLLVCGWVLVSLIAARADAQVKELTPHRWSSGGGRGLCREYARRSRGVCDQWPCRILRHGALLHRSIGAVCRCRERLSVRAVG